MVILCCIADPSYGRMLPVALRQQALLVNIRLTAVAVGDGGQAEGVTEDFAEVAGAGESALRGHLFQW